MQLKDTNPYAPPTADLNATFGGGTLNPSPTMSVAKAEAIRTELLMTETNLRGFGALYLFAAFGSVLAGFGLAAFAATQGIDDVESIFMITFTGFVVLVIAAVYGFVGLGLRRLDPKVKIAATVLGGLSLLSIPIGTLLGGWLLYLLHGEKGQRVFALDYPEVMRLTPHIQRRTSPIVWVFVGLLLLIVVAGVMAGLLA